MKTHLTAETKGSYESSSAIRVRTSYFACGGLREARRSLAGSVVGLASLGTPYGKCGVARKCTGQMYLELLS
jgi:hypothetical protein